MTIVGDAGVGKSRLAVELLASIDASVVHGRCLPYGDGITYWPVAEVLKQLDEMPADEAVADVVRSVLGEGAGPTSSEEIAWAFRKALEGARGTGRWWSSSTTSSGARKRSWTSSSTSRCFPRALDPVALHGST